MNFYVEDVIYIYGREGFLLRLLFKLRTRRRRNERINRRRRKM